MRKLIGTIDCDDAKQIEDGAVITVSVSDVSIACAPSVTMGKVVIKDVKSFPFNYEVDYDEKRMIDMPRGRFSVSAGIRSKSDKLLFINDTFFSITDDETDKPLERVDFSLIVVQPSD